MFEEDMYENGMSEGGRLFDRVDQIRGDIAQKVASDLIEMLKKKFPGVRIEPSGSTMKKGRNEYCGDIDIAIDMPYNEENMDELTAWMDENFPGCEKRPVPGFHLVSIEYPYQENGEQKYVQADVKLTDNFDWCQAYTYSPSSSESKFKSMAKNILLASIASIKKFDGDDPEGKYQDEYFTDDDYAGTKYAGAYTGKIKNKWRYSLDPSDGLNLSHKTVYGKTKMLASNELLPDGTKVERPKFQGMKDANGNPEKILLTNNYNEAVKMILGPEATLEDAHSVEGILNYIFSGKFKTTPEELEDIKEAFLHSMARQKAVHPENDGSIRTNERIDQMIEDFKELWSEHAGSSSLNESRCSQFGMKINDLVRRMNLL